MHLTLGLSGRPWTSSYRADSWCRSVPARVSPLAWLLLALWTTVVVTVAPARGGDLQSWNGYEFKVLKAGPVEWGLDGQIRVREQLSDIYDRRVGTSATFEVCSGLSIDAGYLLRVRDWPGLNQIDWDHRVVAGITYPISQRDLRIEGRTAYERHIGQPGIEAFNRYRQQFEIEHGRDVVSPWLYQDLTFRREGFVRSRSRLGIRWRPRSGYARLVAYQFESLRAASVWRPRHAIYTEFEIDKPKIEGALRSDLDSTLLR